MGILWLLPAILGAQTAWPPTLSEKIGGLAPDQVLLLVREADFDSYLVLDDEPLLKLRVESQLVLMALPPKVADDLWVSRGWGNTPRWVLVNAQGEAGGHGVAPPKGGAILDFLGTKGVKPRWEVREDFLKDHPTQGDAWGESVQRGFALARNRLRALQAKGQVTRPAKPLTPSSPFQQTYTFTSPIPEIREEQADKVFSDWAQALEGLRQVDNWPAHSNGIQAFLLKVYGAGTSPRIRNVCRRMLQDLEAHVREEPDGMAANGWPMLSELAGNPPDRLPQDIVPLPGRIWPPLPFMTSGVRPYLADSDWSGALAFLSAATPVAAPGGQDPGVGEELRFTLAVWELEKVMPLVQLDKEGEALAALEAARHLAGAQWAALVHEGLAFPFPLDDPSLSERLRTALAAAPLPDVPAPPAKPPCKFTLLGQPTWSVAWGALRKSDALLSWSPGEISWAGLDDAQSRTLRASHAWGPEPRWVLSRGGETLASGLDCPTSGYLAGLLSAQGPSALQALDAILERHPDHNAARRARVEVLKARMPEPRLEPRLAEDERLVWRDEFTRPQPLDFGPEAPWKPDPALWQWAATQALPPLQDKLEQWPGSAALWVDWVSWSEFHPGKPSPVALAKALPIWGSRDRWAKGLPMEVHKAVGQALKARGDLKGAVDWLLDAWEVQPKTPAAEITQENWDGFARGFLKDLGEAVVKPLEEDLVSLGRAEEARDIERTFKSMSAR